MCHPTLTLAFNLYVVVHAVLDQIISMHVADGFVALRLLSGAMHKMLHVSDQTQTTVSLWCSG